MFGLLMALEGVSYIGMHDCSMDVRFQASFDVAYMILISIEAASGFVA